MLQFNDDQFNKVNQCPWCGSKLRSAWGQSQDGVCAVRCKDCSLIYMEKVLTPANLKQYYADHLNRVHIADNTKIGQRHKMYELEFAFVDKFTGPCSVLDVGCSGGYFLDVFKAGGYQTHGVELGEEGAKECGKKHAATLGDFATLDFDQKYDLITFRGVIEHIPNPRDYLDKAISLLNDNGCVFITSTPNSDSIICKVFKNHWRLHNPIPHLMHFSVKHFDEYFSQHDMSKVGEHFFYEETPYADVENDILAVARAIELNRQGKEIDFLSPPFYGVMMSVVYQKS